jgi:thiamine biosynthesis lipoprotein
MACRFEITLPHWERAGVRVAACALDEIDRLDRRLTVFRDTSEVSYINHYAAAGAVPVEPSLFALLRLCGEVWRETAGAFDITATPLSRCWGFLRREGRLPAPQEIEQARTLVGNDHLLLDTQARTIGFARPGVEINLGSIGKGYALDCVAALMQGPTQAALLSAGASSIRALGGGDRWQDGWAVGIRHPHDPHRRLAVLSLRDCAMSTSGSQEQYFEHAGRRYGHIIDPRTGWPAEGVATVTVVASSAAVSDALATAFYVGGPELAAAYCAAHPDVLVILLESRASRPLLFGSHRQCRVEVVCE